MKYTGDFFSDSITLYGNNKDGNRSFSATKQYRINHNNITDEQTSFMNQQEISLLKTNEDIRFMSYNPALLEQCAPEIRKHAVCYNKQDLLNFLNSKVNFRNISRNVCPTLHSEILEGSQCDYSYFKKLFPGYDKFIVQSDVASGGYGTYLLDENNIMQVMNSLSKNDVYLISPYYENNIPVNIHAIIYEDDILVFPASIQIMLEDGNRLLYRGADYICYKNIDNILKESFKNNTIKICKKLRDMGYRGVLGIDAMIVNDEVLMLEMNNRFQASTIAINKALHERNIKSIQELNYESFLYKKPSIDRQVIENLDVKYSCFTYIKENNIAYKAHVKNILQKVRNSQNVAELLLDGYDEICTDVEDEAYLFRIIFNTNILSISEEKQIVLHSNIQTPSQEWYSKIVNKEDFIRLKISLLNQGVVLTENAKSFLQKHGGMQPGVYCSVDLIVDDRYAINSPLYVKFTEFSPFFIEYKREKLVLLYYGIELYTVTIDFADNIAKEMTTNNVPVGKICLKAMDRLRIQNCSFCTFKEHNVPCRFCEAQYKTVEFGVEDILQSVDMYFENCEVHFKHVLIGGLSNEIGAEKEVILKICNSIRKHSNMNIYLMCLPPTNLDDINEYVSAGVTEVGFNIEIFDRKLAKELMPGKGAITIEKYLDALKRATQLLGTDGAVRSAFVVGLESLSSTLDGIELMCKLGVSPILSVFRPIPGTELENVIAPSNEYLYKLFIEAEKISKKYDVPLGPTCAYCQNNTLSLKEL